jgi:flavin reductase (DIM6/NTAB) family NADH-FMN oxidoreductase RutF
MRSALQALHAVPPVATTPAEDSAGFDTRAFRDTLGRYPTGVTIVTLLDANARPLGLTANSFNALSLDPPLVVWSLRESSPTLPALLGGEFFAVNILAEGQVELSRRFATSDIDKFADTAWAANEEGVPLLHGAAAWIACRTVSHQQAGDHVLFIAQVLRFSATDQAPLVFHSGGYRLLGERL